MKSAARRSLALAAIWAVAAAAAWADGRAGQDKQAQAAPATRVQAVFQDITILAVRLERDAEAENRVTAIGAVEITYRGLRLFADRVEIDTQTKDVTATGDVALHLTGGEIISAKTLAVNLDTSLGRLVEARGLLPPDLRFRSASAERKEEDLYSLGRSSITPCTQAVPRWEFSCARANLKRDEYVEMWGAAFKIKGLPVLWLPYLKYPLNRERSTGFLMPMAGYTSIKGAYLSEGFYWAAARNTDFTLTADLYSRQGAGLGAEWRYLFGDGTAGALNLYGFRFSRASTVLGAGGTRDAAIVRWSHNQTLPGGFRVVANVDYQSSFDFLREFDNSFQRAMVSNRRSEVYVSKTWSLFSLDVRASQFETLFPDFGGGASDSIITRDLPQISLNSFKIKVAGPVYLSFGSRFSAFEYGWKSDLDAGRGTKVQSASFAPVLSAPWAGIPWLSANVSAGGNFNYFWQSYSLTPAGERGAIVNEPVLSYSGSLSVELLGPVFTRIYEAKRGARFKHVIEPSVAYRYESPVAARERVISPYGFYRYHQLVYGITNHVLKKEGGGGPGQGAAPREIFTWGISQTYFFDPEESPQSLYKVEGETPAFSEVSSFVRFYPAGAASVDFSANWNPYYKTLSSVRLGAGWGNEGDPVFARVSWYKSLNAWFKGQTEVQWPGGIPGGPTGIFTYYDLWERQQLGLAGGANLPRLNLEMRGEADYNITEKKLLYTAASLVYHYQCVDLSVEARVFYFRDTPETRFSFNIGIGNIGRTVGALDQ